MKKLPALILITAFLFALTSCGTDMGTPPDLVLRFSINNTPELDGSVVKVDYTITNDGEGDLENCKIQIAIDTNNSHYTYWTGGVDLPEGRSHSVIDEEIPVSGTTTTIVAVYVIAAGFDDYSRSSGSPERTIIYYDKKIKQ
ncbi:MAG: hypothetical protein H7A26_00890 [Spirochaetales bacterium]|nr:hypothetical protein [Spirochaetales bacterium]